MVTGSTYFLGVTYLINLLHQGNKGCARAQEAPGVRENMVNSWRQEAFGEIAVMSLL